MPFIITAAQLRGIAGAKAPRVEEIAAAFNDYAPKVGLDNQLLAAHFFAQLAHESGGFKYVKELWGPTAAQLRYDRHPTLGNLKAGDGKRYMGRGLIQVTGRANHVEFTTWAKANFPEAPDFVATPEMLERFPWALVSAFWYWHTRRINRHAERDDLEDVTRAVNGGHNGLADRRVKLALAKKAFASSVAIPPGVIPKLDQAGRPTLRKGSKGDAVGQLQTMLGITADKSFGPKTEAEVIAFQRDNDLLPDGTVGPLTWEKLDQLPPAA